MNTILRQTLVGLLMATTTLGSVTALAAPVSPEAALTGPEATRDARGQLASQLARDEVRAGFTRLGVSPDDVAARVAALSDAEVQALAGRVDQARVGGDILGAAVFVFLVLLATDILGFTKLFPFTRPIR